MQAEIITIGDEILIGQVVDTNSAYISKQLNKIGVKLEEANNLKKNKKYVDVLGKIQDNLTSLQGDLRKEITSFTT